MARTIAEIQNQIISQKNQQAELAGLNNTSKTAIWRLWIYIVASAIWIHEKIVEKNALVTRPHTLNWYRTQALNFVFGQNLIWQDGSYQFDTNGLSEAEIEEKKIVKHCAVSEVDLSTVIEPNSTVEQVFSDYFHNQVGVVFIKVAKNQGDVIKPLDPITELPVFEEYIANIKDAGNQVRIISINGDRLQIQLDVYVDPLQVFINPADIEQYRNLINGVAIPADYQFDARNGQLINGSNKPVEDAILEYLKNIEFNGAFVKTFLVDQIQKAQGIHIPILKKASAAGVASGSDSSPNLQELSNIEYFIPQSGYFDIDYAKANIKINYLPYTFYRN